LNYLQSIHFRQKKLTQAMPMPTYLRNQGKSEIVDPQEKIPKYSVQKHLLPFNLRSIIRRIEENIRRFHIQCIEIDGIAMNNRRRLILLFRPSTIISCHLVRFYLVCNCATFQICWRRLANFHSSSPDIPSPRSFESHCSSLKSEMK
jgi:hypothetical protein